MPRRRSRLEFLNPGWDENVGAAQKGMLLNHARHSLSLSRRRFLVAVVERARQPQQRRGLKSIPPKGPFDIFFLGGDEFSVVVLEQLLQHRGMSDA